MKMNDASQATGAQRPRTGACYRGDCSREGSPLCCHPPALPEKSQCGSGTAGGNWLTRGGRVLGVGIGCRPGWGTGPRDHLRQPTASRAFTPAATDSLQALKPRLVLTATSLPISSFAFWTKNVSHYCSRGDVQVLSHRCAVRSLPPESYRNRVISADCSGPAEPGPSLALPPRLLPSPRPLPRPRDTRPA